VAGKKYKKTVDLARRVFFSVPYHLSTRLTARHAQTRDQKIARHDHRSPISLLRLSSDSTHEGHCWWQVFR